MKVLCVALILAVATAVPTDHKVQEAAGRLFARAHSSAPSHHIESGFVAKTNAAKSHVVNHVQHALIQGSNITRHNQTRPHGGDHKPTPSGVPSGVAMPFDLYSGSTRVVVNGQCRESCRPTTAKPITEWRWVSQLNTAIPYTIQTSFSSHVVLDGVRITTSAGEINAMAASIPAPLGTPRNGTAPTPSPFENITITPVCRTRGQANIHLRIRDPHGVYDPVHIFVRAICGGEVSDLCDDVSCNGYGSCINGTCECEFGHFGPYCASSIFAQCPQECNGNARDCVRDGASYRCLCKAGFGGEACNHPIGCPALDHCSGHGQCIENEVCACDHGFTGRTCSLTVETDQYCASLDYCKGHGKCEREGEGYKCECEEGYEGVDCGRVVRTCPSSCSGHGICVESHCNCNFGFRGDDCSEVFSPCGGCKHGRCTESLENEQPQCDCDAGFTGAHCTVYDRNSDPCKDSGFCSGHGKCLEGTNPPTCACDPGFFGDRCTKLVMQGCVNWCGNRGRCDAVTDTCQCRGAWSGEDCSVARCPSTNGAVCAGNGACVENPDSPGAMTCECETGFFGASCQNALCKANVTCSGHGACKKSSGVWNKLCDCNDGFAGDFCETRVAKANSGKGNDNKQEAEEGRNSNFASRGAGVTVDPDELDDFADVVR